MSQRDCDKKQTKEGKMRKDDKEKPQQSNQKTTESEEEKGGTKKNTVTATCLLCLSKFETTDPENFLLPHHKIPNSKFSPQCGASKRSFTYPGKPIVNSQEKPEVQDLPPINIIPYNQNRLKRRQYQR